ncbi:MAG TPA: NAD(+) diphosphatase [Gammaproteobacteria bacterium]
MRSLENIFGQPGTDRRTIKRADDDWIEMLRESPATRFVIIDTQHCLVDDTPSLVRLPHAALPDGWRKWQTVFLGDADETPLFALAAASKFEAHFETHGRFAELRPLALLLSATDAALIAHARAVMHWHQTHRYCGSCGSELHCASAGHARRCLNDACNMREIFPRIDPAVIMLVTHEDRCLLGRQRGWPEGRYSCLAGFAEAGETLEEAVRREVLEESGVHVDDVVYHSSQPWPFPQSLMIGFRARALSPEIILHDDELEDARWFSRDDIRRQLAAGTLKPSARLSIAYRLLHDWYAEKNDPADLDTHAI